MSKFSSFCVFFSLLYFSRALVLDCKHSNESICAHHEFVCPHSDSYCQLNCRGEDSCLATTLSCLYSHQTCDINCYGSNSCLRLRLNARNAKALHIRSQSWNILNGSHIYCPSVNDEQSRNLKMCALMIESITNAKTFLQIYTKYGLCDVALLVKDNVGYIDMHRTNVIIHCNPILINEKQHFQNQLISKCISNVKHSTTLYTSTYLCFFSCRLMYTSNSFDKCMNISSLCSDVFPTSYLSSNRHLLNDNETNANDNSGSAGVSNQQLMVFLIILLAVIVVLCVVIITLIMYFFYRGDTAFKLCGCCICKQRFVKVIPIPKHNPMMTKESAEINSIDIILGKEDNDEDDDDEYKVASDRNMSTLQHVVS